MIPDRSLGSDSSENGVSFRVEACRKRLRIIRADKKTQIGRVQSLKEAPINCGVEAYPEMSASPEVIEARPEALDEAGLT